MTDEIRDFYSRINFPGHYTWEDICFYGEHGIHNIYLKEIDKVLKDDIDVLDVGCGTGLVSNLFAHRYSSSFTSIDFSDSINYAMEFSKKNKIKNVRWVKKDFLKFSTEKKYDVIICCGVLHHIPEYKQALDKIKSLLKPDGKLILAVYNKYGKILKHLIKIDYNSPILYEDQENNPFELSFTHQQVLNMCSDLEFNSVNPGWSNRFVNLLAWTNSENGGLTLYVFTKK